MRLCLCIAFFFVSSAFAQDYFETSCQYEGKDVQCAGGAFCAMGEGNSGGEARKDALRNIAGQVSSSINASDSSIYRQSESVSSRGRRSSESEEKIRSEVLKTVLENVSLKTFEQKTVKNKVYVPAYVCKLDVAKSYLDKQRKLAEDMEMSVSTDKNKAWDKVQNYWNEFMSIQIVLDALGVESKYLASAKKSYEKASKDHKDNLNARLHWNPEKQTAYSDIAFAKLSEVLEIEASPCKGKGISLVYNGAKPECKSRGGPYACTYQPSLQIASCDGTKIRLLESPEPIKGFDSKEETAIRKLQEKLKTENFWNEWEQEIKQRSPQ